MKESSANYSGDGPSESKENEEIDYPIEFFRRISLSFNGINVKKIDNGVCIINEINSMIIRERTTKSLQVGDVVTKINNVLIKDLTEIEINKMLSNTIMTSITSKSKTAYDASQRILQLRQQQQKCNLEETKQLQALGMQLNGLQIARRNRISPFKVQAFNNSILQSRISINISLGDIISKINNTDLYQMDNRSAAQYLATNVILSIKSYSPKEYRSTQNRSNASTVHADYIPTSNSETNTGIIGTAYASSVHADYTSTSNSETNTGNIGTSYASPVHADYISNSQTNTGNIGTAYASPVHADYISNSNSQTNTGIMGTAYNRDFNSLENNFNNSSALNTTPPRRDLNINFQIENTPQRLSFNNISEITTSNTNNITNCISVEWDYEHPCLFCNCIYLKCEKNRKMCCHNGGHLTVNSNFPKLKPLPPQIKFLCIERTPHFSRNSVSYNNILALGATGVDNGTANRGWEYRFEDSCITLHGRTYHFLCNSAGMGGFRYFLYDAQAAMLQHGNDLNNFASSQENLRIYPNFLQLLYNELKDINILVNEVDRIGRDISTNEHVLGDTPNYIVNLNATTSHFDVAAISSMESNGERILKIRRKGSQLTTNIHVTDSKLEPLSYPLFFPYGENGWGENIRKSIKFPSYLLSRILMGELNEDGTFLLIRNKKGKLISVNRFQLMSRLGQTFLVDNVSRAIDYRLAWHKKHQEDVFGVTRQSTLGSPQESNDDNNDVIDSEQSFLGQSFHGSRRHLRSLSANALSIVSEYGRPSIFITLTCNAYWEEITEMLLESQVL